jgi:outer membrane receptor for ferrienterochelin and colicin
MRFCAIAQTGEIRGTVIEKSTGEPMTGASVVIEALVTGTSADFNGNYTLKVAPGTYTLKVSFIAFNTVEITDVKVEAGRTTEANVVMEEAASSLGEVTVVAMRRMNSEASMISNIKTSNIVVSGISAQQITKTQDRDASEVIKRIPGISIIDNRFIIARGLSQRYNNVWVNNNAVPSSEADSRSFSFDMIPSGQIENIMIIKSPAPELPADFTGSFVKVATKSVPENNTLQINYGININTTTHFRDFKSAEGSPTDFLGFDNGFRGMRSVVPSQRIDNSNKELVSDVTAKGFNNDWLVRSNKPLVDHRFSAMLNHFSQLNRGRQFGVIAALNYSYSYLAYQDMTNARFGIYNQTDNCPVYLYKYADDQYTITARTGGMLNLIWILSDKHRLEFRNIFNQQGRDRYTYRDGWQNISSRYEQRKEEYFYNSRSTYTGQLSGFHTLSEAGKLDWTAGYAYANKNQPDRRQIDREEERDLFSMNSIIRDFNRLDEHTWSAGVNYNHTLAFASLKAGAYAEHRSRTYNTRYFLYKANLANLPQDFLYRDVATGMMLPEFFSADKFFISDASDRTNDYAGESLLMSGYTGLNIPLGQFNIYAGVRYENSLMSLTNHKTINTDETETFNYNSSDFFPSVNATYNINKTNLLRFAYGKSVNRQEFREVSPSSYYDFELFSYVRGNKKLKQAYIQNFDFRYEIYPSNGEMISFALFYKRFTNPIEWTFIDGGGTYTYTFENANQANNYGVELDMKKSLDFIGLPDLSLSFNGSLIRSNVVFDENSMEHDRPMQGQSPYLINTGLFYMKDKLNIGLMYNIIGKRVVGIGRSDNSQGGSINNDVPDMFEMPRHALDLSFSYKLGEHIELSMGVRDMLASPFVFKQFPKFTNGDEKVHQREQTTKSYKSGQNFSLSLKINL